MYVVIANLILSVIAIWLFFSQSIFLSELITSKYWVVAPQSTSNTSPVVINPLTTQAFLVTAYSGIGLIVSVAIIAALLIVFRKKD
jgi:hypothetical protein